MDTPEEILKAKRQVARFWATYVRLLEKELREAKERIAELEKLVQESPET